ncbi:cupredoxin family copper-binding protein [Candidatus Woesearchaeota archaeon]|nr:cupredoxin family copper-binding protein [Candidatus Woesearchaeota archaeon]
MSYNVEFSGEGKSVKAFGEDKIIPDGASDGRLGGDALIPPISTTNYNQVCLVWNPKITSFDGKQEGRFCVPISQYEGAATRPFAEENATVPGAPGANAVTIQNFRFSPNIMTINVGDSITWTNQDDALHTVSTTDGPESFDSGNLAKGQTFRKTFTKAGSYSYQCNNHPSMKGSITVKESGAAPGAPPAPAPKREDFSGF